MTRNETLNQQYQAFLELQQSREALDRRLPPNLFPVWQLHSGFRIDIVEQKGIYDEPYKSLAITLGPSGIQSVVSEGFAGDIQKVVGIVNEWLAEEQK
jgi:hypothetical protein